MTFANRDDDCVCGHTPAWHYTSQWGHTAICHFDCGCTKYRPEGMWEEMQMKDGTKVTRLSHAALADAFALLDDMEETLSDGNSERTTEGTLTAYEWWRDLRSQQDRRLLNRPITEREPEPAPTCCGKCPSGTCYVDGVTGA